MSKRITIDDDTYKLLRSLKQGPGDSFTKVIRRNVYKPLDTCGELLDAYEQDPPPQRANLEALRRSIERRDAEDRARKAGPLVKPPGAIEIDTSGLTLEGVVARILAAIGSP